MNVTDFIGEDVQVKVVQLAPTGEVEHDERACGDKCCDSRQHPCDDGVERGRQQAARSPQACIDDS